MATSFKKSMHALLHSVYSNPHPRHLKSHPRSHRVHSPGSLGNGKVKVKSLSHVTKSCLTLWDPMDCSLPEDWKSSPSMGVSRQEYWSGLPFPSPGDLPNQGIEPRSSTLQSDTLPSKPPAMGSSLHYMPPFCMIT